MSMKVSQTLDIHTGGVEHIPVHHTNEMAQSEAATGKPFFNVWMHGAFLIISGGKKMAKSDGNFLTLENAFLKKDIDPLAYRYATFLTHYRKPMEYSEDAMTAAQNGLQHLRNQVRTLKEEVAPAERETGTINDRFREKFRREINDDLNMPRPMAVVKELLKNDVIVLTTGCNAIACAMEGLLTPESAKVFCGPGLAEVCETVGMPPVLGIGSCVDNSRILLAATICMAFVILAVLRMLLIWPRISLAFAMLRSRRQ